MFHPLKRRLSRFVAHDPNIARYLAYRVLIKRFVVPILSVYAIDVGLTLAQIATIAVISSVVALALEIPSGMLADKWGHKRTLVMAQIVSVISMALYIPAYGGNAFFWLLTAAILYFGAGAFLSGTTSALFYEYLQAHKKEDQYQKLRGRIKGTANGVGIVTLAIAGAAYGVHPLLPFLVGVAQFVGATYMIWRFDDQHATRHETDSVSAREGFLQWVQHFPNAWKQIRGDTRIFWMTLLLGIAGGVRYANGEFESIILDDASVIPFLIGVMYSLKRLVSTFTLFFSHHLSGRLSATAVAAIGSIGTGLSFVGFWILPLSFALMIPVLVGTFIVYFMDVSLNYHINTLITKGSRATVLSMNGLVLSLTTAALPLWYGLGAAQFSLGEMMALLGLVVAIIGVLGTWRLFEGYRVRQ